MFKIEMMYSEADTRSKFIDPKLYAQGWKEEYIVRNSLLLILMGVLPTEEKGANC